MNFLEHASVSWRLTISLCFLSLSSLLAQEAEPLSKLQQAQQLVQAYEYSKAIPLLQAAVQEDSLSLAPAWLLSQSYAQLGQTADAKEQLKNLIALHPEYTAARGLLARLYLNETNYVAAAECYNHLLAIDSTNAYFQRQRAYTAEKSGDLATALHHYQQAVVIAPQDLESTTELAELWLKLEGTGQAAVLVDQGLRQDSTNLRLRRLQAKLAYKQKNYGQVIKAMTYPLAAGDTAFYYVQLLGISQFHLSNYAEALYWLEYLHQRGVDTEVLNYYLGLSYRNSGNTAKGIQFLEATTEKSVSENLSHYYTQLAVTYEEKGDYANAIRTYQIAYKGSGDKKLLYHLARSYDRHYKDKRVALSYYERYLSELDTANAGYQDYARYRSSQLKEHIHFNADTL